MTAFHNVLFPPKIAYGASGGPEFSTSIAVSLNGFEQRNINWSTARGRWDVSTGLKNSADIDEVVAFFRARFGKAYGFLFKDWMDYRVKNQSIGDGDGEKKEFQLVKDYRSGSCYTYTRKILKPVAASLEVLVNSVPTNDFRCDSTTGVITFNNPPAKGASIVCNFEFNVPVRFDTDQIIIRATGPGRFVSDPITVTEIRQ